MVPETGGHVGIDQHGSSLCINGLIRPLGHSILGGGIWSGGMKVDADVLTKRHEKRVEKLRPAVEGEGLEVAIGLSFRIGNERGYCCKNGFFILGFQRVDEPHG